MDLRRPAASVLLAALAAGCGSSAAPPREPAVRPAGREPVSTRPGDEAFLDDVQHRTFRWFWETGDPATGLVPDRWPSPSFCSVAAVGFGLTAYPIGAERGWITRAQAAERTRTTLQYFLDGPQGPEPAGVMGYRGFFYHFLDMRTGTRFGTVELSSIDTTLFLAGALFAAAYFDGDDPEEVAIRAAADALYRRVEWDWMSPRPPRVGHGWKPEVGFLESDWSGYDEAMVLYVLALASPTHPVPPEAWTAWTSTYRWATFENQPHVNFGPLFGHIFSHTWIDFRGIRDAYMRGKGIDYFENSRRAALAQRAHAVRNPRRWAGWHQRSWGVSACDGPADVTKPFAGENREFYSYSARGLCAFPMRDDGTLSAHAVGGSMPFVPRAALETLRYWAAAYPGAYYGEYGFLDAFNPSFTWTDVPLTHGRVVPGKGWFDTDYLGIDQGPILAMIENHRTGLVWEHTRKSPVFAAGLRRAGFTGGWLDAAP